MIQMYNLQAKTLGFEQKAPCDFFAQSAEPRVYRLCVMLRIASGGSKAKQQALFSSDSNASVPLAQKASVSHSSLGATQSMEQS